MKDDDCQTKHIDKDTIKRGLPAKGLLKLDLRIRNKNDKIL